jgi:hypothetical protein
VLPAVKQERTLPLLQSEGLDEPPVDHEVSPGHVACALAGQHDH